MRTILVVEDDEGMRELFIANLERDYKIEIAQNGLEALEILNNRNIDLIITDIMMPKLDGFDFVKQLRDLEITIPVIMATAKEYYSDKRVGFAVGADDYMTKPLDFTELKWRITALLRRSNLSKDEEITIGDFTMNVSNYEVIYQNESIDLPKKEFELLYKLLSAPNRLFSNDKLMTDIWGYDSFSDDTTIRTHISRLRSKLAHVKELEIVNAKGLGYKIVVKKYEQ